MESRFSAHVLLCGLVLSIYIAWTDCVRLPTNMGEDIDNLKKNLVQRLSTDERTALRKDSSIFKDQLQAMEKQFERDDQKLVVLEMLSAYSSIFDQISREPKRQGDSEVPTLRNHMEMMINSTALDYSRKLRDMQRTIREIEWSSLVEQMKALNDFAWVYKRASVLITKPQPTQPPCYQR